MPSFRKSILLAAFVGTLAKAQVSGGGSATLGCNAFAPHPTPARAESFSELIGDLMIVCSGGTSPSPGTAIPAMTFTLSFDTNVTSRLLPIAGDPSSSNFSEALLLIDEPGSGLSGYTANLPKTLCATPANGCAASVGAVVGSPTYGQSVTSGATPAPNVYQGIVSGNSVSFSGVPFLIPGAGNSRVFRIANVRLNAQSLAAPGGSPVRTTISLGGPASDLLTNTLFNFQITAALQQMTASASDITLVQNSTEDRRQVSFISFQEDYPAAFQTRVMAQTNTAFAGQTNSPSQRTPGFVYYSESGFVLPVGARTAGLADTGTRLKAAFTNIPAGLRLYVSTGNISPAGNEISPPTVIGGSAANGSATTYVGYARLVSAETAPDGDAAAGEFPAVSPTTTAPGSFGAVPAVEIAVVNGTASAVWEVLNTNPNALESFKFGVYVSYSAGTPIPGTAGVQLSYAPTALSANNLSGAPRPIFAPDALAARPIFTIQPSPTYLTISKSHTYDFVQGQTNATYNVGVYQAGVAPPVGAITVTETLPAGLTLANMSGNGWSCTANTCTRTSAVAPGDFYPAITVTVNVAANATSPQVNSVSVSGGNFQTASASDSTTILPANAYQISGASLFASPASTGTVNVVSVYGWNLSSNTPWIHVGGANATTGYYSIDANTSASPRTGSLLISGQPFSITQNGAGNGLRFVPITPCRIADTRNTDTPNLLPSTPRDFPIAGKCGVPTNAEAYSLNLTVVPIGPLGFLSAWPAGQAQPVVSTLNSTDGRVKANAAIVPAGANGAVTLFASNFTNAIIDVNGYFIPASGNSDLVFYPLTPCRIVDTRIGTGALAGPALAAATTRTFPVLSGPCYVPATAQAYALNVTAVPSGPLGFLSVWPAGQGQPGSSTLNAPTGAVTANAAVVPAGTSGGISVIATNPTDVIIDINGYFAPPGGDGGLRFFTTTPCRILDTRDSAGTYGGPALAPSTIRGITIGGQVCGIPDTAAGFSLNATVVPPAALGFLSLWGDLGNGQPTVSTLNAADGSVVANAVLVTADAPAGALHLFASHLTHLILDINGYFAQ